MVKFVSSYKVKIKNYNKIFEPTIQIYRSALSFVISTIEKEWTSISQIEVKGTYRNNAVERLIHSTKSNVAKYHEFDTQFYKFPSYLRRTVIQDALGIVSSYHSNLENWEENGKKGKAPRLTLKHFKFPSLFRDNMFNRLDDTKAEIKIFYKNDWVWQTVELDKHDVAYIQRHKPDHIFKEAVPTLEKRGRNWYLRFAFEQQVSFDKEVKVITAVDLGITHSATCVAMLPDGTVLGRKFISCPREKDQMETQLNRIKRNQQRGNRRNPHLWMFANNKNRAISEKTAQAIMEFATYYSSDVVVFEYLDTQGKKRSSKKQRLHQWRKQEIIELVNNKAHSIAMRVSRVTAWGTSRLAHDGSGRVLRGKEIDLPYGLCQFSTGKQYNTDLNASYNIGARYYIREILKSLSAKKRLAVEAKVPALVKRSTCTLSHLINLSSVLGGVTALKLQGKAV